MKGSPRRGSPTFPRCHAGSVCFHELLRLLTLAFWPGVGLCLLQKLSVSGTGNLDCS